MDSTEIVRSSARTAAPATPIRRKRLLRKMTPRPDTGPYAPVWEGPISAWTAKYAAAQAWKVAPSQGVDDIIQEGQILFWKVSKLYAVKNGRHFMALYMRSLSNRVTNMANKATRGRHVVGLSCLALDEDRSLADLAGLDTDSELAMFAAVERSTATGPVGNVLRKLTDVAAVPRYERRAGIRETTAQFLGRIAEVDIERFNIVGAVLDYLLGEDES